MLVWRGLGLVFPLIMFPLWGILELIIDEPGSELEPGIAMTVAGIISSIIGFKANSKHEGNPHVLFMLPLQIGGIVVALLGLGWVIKSIL